MKKTTEEKMVESGFKPMKTNRQILIDHAIKILETQSFEALQKYCRENEIINEELAKAMGVQT